VDRQSKINKQTDTLISVLHTPTRDKVKITYHSVTASFDQSPCHLSTFN